ncbi:MAG: tripartite tricarboxylate transporter TctB family protein [Planctomycetota bacterium]|jgi:hypothetical protein|nr:tripartite tricarboxylate transporter TctB family protein [Planctomycetota bacterium]
MKIKSWKFLFPAALMALGLIWIVMGVFKYGIYELAGPMPGFFPVLVGLAMFLAAFFDLFDCLKRDKGEMHLMQFLPVLSLMAIVLCAYAIGTFPAMFIFLVLWIRGYEKYDWKTTLITAVAVTLSTWFVFGEWVDVDFEQGWIMRTLAL